MGYGVKNVIPGIQYSSEGAKGKGKKNEDVAPLLVLPPVLPFLSTSNACHASWGPVGNSMTTTIMGVFLLLQVVVGVIWGIKYGADCLCSNWQH